MTQYKEIAEAYSSTERMKHPYRQMLYTRWIEACERIAGTLEGKRVLDLGCGSGDSSRLLAKKRAKVIGIDNEAEMIKIARKKEAKNQLGIRYMEQDARNFNHLRKFDLVTPTNILHYAKTKKDLFAMIRSMAKNLKKNGYVVGFNSDPKNPVVKYRYEGEPYNVFWIDRPWVEGSRIQIELNIKGIKPFYNWWWNPQTYEQFFEKTGFSCLGWQRPEFFHYLKRPPNWSHMEINSVLSIIIARKGGVMKNFSFVLRVLLSCLIVDHAQANGNYLLIRFQNEVREGDYSNGTYSVFENNSLEDWAFGCRLITGENGFMLVAPQVFFKGWGNLQPGIKYTDNSFDSRQIGPALRWKGTLFGKKLFAIVDASYFFGLSGQKDAVDLWINIVTTGEGWNYGTEFRLYRAEETTTETRPLKVGYRFRNGMVTFVMGEIKHKNGKHISNSVYLGVEIMF